MNTVKRLALLCALLASGAAHAQFGSAAALSRPVPAASVALGANISPVLFQHIASSTNPAGIGITGHAFVFHVESLPANTVAVLGVTAPHGTTISISDTLVGSWAAAACKADGGSGNNLTAVFVQALGSSAGTDTVTIGVGATNIDPVQFDWTAWQNINTRTPVNGCLGTPTLTGATISPGTVTPGTNTANGGVVLWNYVALNGTASSNPTGWTAGTNYSLLNGDILWISNQGFPEASQYYTQPTPSSSAPKITATGDTADSYNSVTVGLNVANNGAAAPSTIHVIAIGHESFQTFASPGTMKIQVPWRGNLRVLAFTWNGMSPGAGAGSITAITSSDSCNFTGSGSGGSAWVWYAQNCSPCLTCTVSMTWTGTYTAPQGSFRYYDVNGAASSSFQNGTGNNGTCGTSVTNSPTITPSGATSGLIIAELGNGNGPVTNVSSPTGATFDLWNFTNQTDSDMADNADESSHYYYSSTASQNWNYTKTNGSDSCYWWAAAFN